MILVWLCLSTFLGLLLLCSGDELWRGIPGLDAVLDSSDVRLLVSPMTVVLKRLLLKLGSPQLQHVQESSLFAIILNMLLAMLMHDLWYHLLHASQAIAGLFQFTAFSQVPHGYFVFGPGFGCTSLDNLMVSNANMMVIAILDSILMVSEVNNICGAKCLLAWFVLVAPIGAWRCDPRVLLVFVLPLEVPGLHFRFLCGAVLVLGSLDNLVDECCPFFINDTCHRKIHAIDLC